MGLGSIGLQTSQKKEQAGAPFTPTSAENGVSINTSGEVVLGNDVGAVGSPAILLSNREIITQSGVSSFSLFLNAAVTGITTGLDGRTIAVTGANNTNPLISVTTGTPGTSLMRLQANNDRFDQQVSGGGSLLFRVGTPAVTSYCMVNVTTRRVQFGPTLQALNNADFQVSGTLTRSVLVRGPVAGGIAINQLLDSDELWINGGLLTLTLPLTGVGTIVRVAVLNALGIVFQAGVGQTILFGAAASTAGGTLTSVTVGSTATVTLVTATIWVTEAFTGTWVPA